LRPERLNKIRCINTLTSATTDVNDSKSMEEATVTHKKIIECIGSVQMMTAKILVD
jgi:hypothetical protein